LFSDFAWIRRFPAMFAASRDRNKQRSSRENWVLGWFSLLAKSAVPFSKPTTGFNIDQAANIPPNVSAHAAMKAV
jgi:hypothetical protein